jgi:hypothetical protein
MANYDIRDYSHSFYQIGGGGGGGGGGGVGEKLFFLTRYCFHGAGVVSSSICLFSTQHSPTARDSQTFQVFSQHPACFSQSTETWKSDF